MSPLVIEGREVHRMAVKKRGDRVQKQLKLFL